MEREIIIKTERLALRPLTRADIPAMVALLDDYDVARWLSVVPYPYTRADGLDFLNHLDKADPGEALAIVTPEGFGGVVGIGPGLGYWLGRAFWRRGYMTEAAAAMIGNFFTRTDADLLPSGYFEGNTASARVLHKLGFRPDGEERVKSRAQGVEVTLKKVILSRADWQARHGF